MSEEQKDLFGNELPKPALNKMGKKRRSAEVRHADLLRIYGAVDDKCKNCVHLLIKRYSKTYFKCMKSGLGNGASEGTDWRSGWQACGQFQNVESEKK